MLATKDKADPAAPAGAAKEGSSLTPEQQKSLRDDSTIPEGFAKGPRTPAPEEPAAPGPAAAAPAEPAAPGPGPAKPADPTKPGEGAAKPPAPAEPDDAFTKIERELAKPEGQENLEGFSTRETAYFHQMRRDRKARQKAEAERDVALRNQLKLKKQLEGGPAPKPAASEDPRLAALKKRDPTDFLTVKDVIALLDQPPAPAPAKAEEDPPDSGPPAAQNPMTTQYLMMCEREARAAHPEDFDAVMELADELVNVDAAHLRTVAEETRNGKNPAEVVYGIIKAHQDFAKLFPAAQIRAKARQDAKAKPAAAAPAAAPAAPAKPAAPPAKSPEDQEKERQALAAQQALEQNAGKTRTTGHAGSTEGKPATELTAEEIAAMSDREFAKLPRHVREAYLRKYG